MQQSSPYISDGYWRDLILRSSPPQALLAIFMFTGHLCVCPSTRLIEDAFIFLTLMSEHSVLELVGALAVLIGYAWLSVAKSF